MYKINACTVIYKPTIKTVQKKNLQMFTLYLIKLR